MHCNYRTFAIGAILALCTVAAVGSQTAKSPPAGMSAHALIVRPDQVKWKPLHPGSEIATVSGEPDKAGAPFVLRFRYHGVVKIPPHWHPTDEHITVLSGAFMVGMGERFDESSATELAPGSYALLPMKMAHYAWSKGDTVLQVHGIGPFMINYVNPADDPNKGIR